MNRSAILICLAGLCGFFSLAPSSAAAFEPVPPPYLEEPEEDPPGLPAPSPAVEAPADETPRDTVINRVLAAPGHRSVEVFFGSTEADSSFACRFDGRTRFGCHSPLVLRHLGPGHHTVSLVAVDPSGNVDPTPATFGFRVPALRTAGAYRSD